jgi:hypothetical protein
MNTRITRLVAAYEQGQRLRLARYYGKRHDDEDDGE